MHYCNTMQREDLSPNHGFMTIQKTISKKGLTFRAVATDSELLFLNGCSHFCREFITDLKMSFAFSAICLNAPELQTVLTCLLNGPYMLVFTKYSLIKISSK